MLESKDIEVEEFVKKTIVQNTLTCDKCGLKMLLEEGTYAVEIPVGWITIRMENYGLSGSADNYFNLCPACIAKPINLTSEVFNA